MDRLPVELIEKILSHRTITVQDVCNFSASAKFFRDLVSNSSVIWKHKFRDKWPKLTHLFDNLTFDINFFEETQYIYNLRNLALSLLEQMPQRFNLKYHLRERDCKEWADLLRDKEQTYYYLVMILTEIINTNESIKSIEVVPLNTPGNKTLQYYTRKVLRFIKQKHLSKAWEHYKFLPPKKQTLEKGAIFIAQWCQADLDIAEESIETELDFIANLVKERVSEINPHHPLLRISENELDVWRHENLERCQWSNLDCRQIIVAMREVMYGELGFCGNRDNYYMSENSLINKVLERRTGLPILLAIVYEAVGRRLGLLFEPINFPSHFLLRFTEIKGNQTTAYYIDTFNDGDLMQNVACPYSSPSTRAAFPVATSLDVIERMVNNLGLSTKRHVEPNGGATLRGAVEDLEMLVLVDAQHVAAVVNLENDDDSCPLYSGRGGSVAEGQDRATERPPHVKYAVGMVMCDLARNDKCVIYAWTTRSCAVAESGMSLERPESSGGNADRTSVRYGVMAEDGSYRVLPQDMLVPCSTAGSLHSCKDLGRCFSHFFENHFVPNAETEKRYPHDARVRHKFYHEMLLSNYKP